MADVPQLFIVVCTRYHSAYGIFATPDAALARARELTESDTDCDYVPVAFDIEGAQFHSGPPTPDHGSHGYL